MTIFLTWCTILIVGILATRADMKRGYTLFGPCWVTCITLVWIFFLMTARR